MTELIIEPVVEDQDEATAKRRLVCEHELDEQVNYYLDGFAHADRKFHFAPHWSDMTPQEFGANPTVPFPRLPDHHAVIEESDDEMPFRLVTAPARHFLNSSFTETPTSQRRERRPSLMIHPADAAALNLEDGAPIRMGNTRGEIELVIELFEGVQRGVVISESIWPNHAYPGGLGINALTGADPTGPVGGAAFHDNRVWIRTAQVGAIN